MLLICISYSCHKQLWWMANKLTEEWLPDSTSFLFCFPALEIICDLGNGIATGRVPPSVPPTQKKFTVSNLPSPPTEKNPPPTIRKSSPVWPSAPSSIRDKVHDTWTCFYHLIIIFFFIIIAINLIDSKGRRHKPVRLKQLTTFPDLF